MPTADKPCIIETTPISEIVYKNMYGGVKYVYDYFNGTTEYQLRKKEERRIVAEEKAKEKECIQLLSMIEDAQIKQDLTKLLDSKTNKLQKQEIIRKYNKPCFMSNPQIHRIVMFVWNKLEPSMSRQINVLSRP